MSAIITRESAICMFLLAPYDPVLAHSFLARMEQLGALDICYKRDRPNEPMLLSKLKINSDPTTYLLYPSLSMFHKKPESLAARILNQFK